MIKIKIDNIYSYISDVSSSDIFDKINDDLSFYVEGYAFSKAFRNGYYDSRTKAWKQWDGKKYLATKSGNGLKFMTGLVSRVTRILNSFHAEYEVQDTRSKLKKAEPLPLKHVESRPYQDRVVDAVFATTNGGIVKNCTASGKTVVIARLLSQMGAGRKDGPKVNIFVVTKDLLYQTHSELQKFLGIKIGIIGDGLAEIRNINVISVWTCSACFDQKYQPKDDEDYATKEKWDAGNKKKVLKAIEAADVFLVDECHMSATVTIVEIRKHSKSASFVLGLSGTPWRGSGELDETDSLLIEAVCGPFIMDAEVTASELIAKGYLVPPTIHFISVPPKDDLPKNYQAIYKEYIVENEARNALIVKAAIKLVTMGKNVLILVKQIKHGDILLEQLQEFKTFFVRGETDSETRVYLKNEFEKGNIQVMIASQIYDMGINLPNLESIVLAGGTKSSGRVLQRIGRILRKCPGKEKAIVIDFLDDCKYLTQHSAERLRVYQTESGFKIILPKRTGTNENNEQTKKKKAVKLPPNKPGGEPLPW